MAEKKKTKYQQIIERLVIINKNPSFWGREIKVIKNLEKKGINIDFLLQLEPPYGYRVSSMIFFLKGEGEIYIKEKQFEYRVQNSTLTPKQEQMELATDKIGEDVEIKKQPKNLKEFLNFGY